MFTCWHFLLRAWGSEERNIVSLLPWMVKWPLALITLLVTAKDPFQKPLLSTLWTNPTMVPNSSQA